MTELGDDTNSLIRRAQGGEQWAIAALFTRSLPRLKQTVRLRMDHRLQARFDSSDVLQEVYFDYARRLPEYTKNPKLPFFLWLRFLTTQRLVDLHRRHLGAAKRDAGQERSLYRGALPQASSVSLAAQLLGRLTTASQAAIRAETQMRVQQALNQMDPIDREVLALRHFEMLSNEETAAVLGIKSSATSKRHIRALKRLKETLRACSDLSG